jgi:hypothetical protein
MSKAIKTDLNPIARNVVNIQYIFPDCMVNY